MTAGLPNISSENGFINRLRRGVGHVSLFFLTLWAFLAKNGNCTIDGFWASFVTCGLRLKWGFWRKQLSSTFDFFVGVWEIGTNSDWDVLPSKEVCWSWRRQVELVEWDGLSSKEVKIDADRRRYYNRVRQMSVTLREAATFGIKMIIMMIMAVGEPWRWVDCTGCKPGISNKLPDHDDMTAWMFKFASLKVEISPCTTLGQIRSSGLNDVAHVTRLNIPAKYSK